MKRPILAAVALSAVAALGGCGAGPPDLGAGRNAADVEFVRGMVPHHDQAVAMAALAAGRAQRPEVEGLARRIEETQRPELATLRSWLEEWGDEVTAATVPATAPPAASAPEDEAAGGHGHGGRPFSVAEGIDGATGMGLADGAELARLEAASGAEFDRYFVELMAEHHQGAIAMATREVGLGRNAEAKSLARAIREAQGAELEELRRLGAGA